jgi:hypothetical protein
MSGPSWWAHPTKNAGNPFLTIVDVGCHWPNLVLTCGDDGQLWLGSVGEVNLPRPHRGPTVTSNDIKDSPIDGFRRSARSVWLEVEKGRPVTEPTTGSSMKRVAQ